MYCQNCGSKLVDNADVCLKCGCRVLKHDNNSNNVVPIIPDEYKPISAWGYCGYQILFVMPLIGFIFLLVFSFGGTRNKNVRNYARSHFCFLIIAVVIYLFLSAIGYEYSVSN